MQRAGAIRNAHAFFYEYDIMTLCIDLEFLSQNDSSRTQPSKPSLTDSASI